MADRSVPLADHIAAINKTLGKVTLPHVVSDFAGAMKNKRTFASLLDAIDTELARAKIDATQAADGIRLSMTSLTELAVDYAFLFNHVQQLVTKANSQYGGSVTDSEENTELKWYVAQGDKAA